MMKRAGLLYDSEPLAIRFLCPALKVEVSACDCMSTGLSGIWYCEPPPLRP